MDAWQGPKCKRLAICYKIDDRFVSYICSQLTSGTSPLTQAAMFREAHLLFLCTLVAGTPIKISGKPEENFTLVSKKIVPCQLTKESGSVSLYQSDILAVQRNFTYCSSSAIENQYIVS